MFVDACREWGRRADATKTWAQFKIDFAQAHTKLGEMTHTTQAGGYHNANNVSNYLNETGEALANLATATAADRDMLRSLQATNEQLLQQNAVKDAELTQLRSQLQQFQAGLSNRNNNNSNNNRRPNNARRGNNNNNNQNSNMPYNNNQNNNNQNNTNQNNNNQNQPGLGRKRYQNLNYCWTHGYDLDFRHDSSNCRNPANGHQHTATRTNLMGGSEANKARSMN
jgi:hypothetical protein